MERGKREVEREREQRKNKAKAREIQVLWRKCLNSASIVVGLKFVGKSQDHVSLGNNHQGLAHFEELPDAKKQRLARICAAVRFAKRVRIQDPALYLITT